MLASQKSELTRKNDRYAFDVSTLGFQNTRWTASCHSPTAAKRSASATWATSAARRPEALQPSWATRTIMNPNGR